MTISTPITDDDVEGYLDERLDPARRSEVERWLERHPDRLAEVRLFQEQQAALRRLADDMLDDPIPDRFLALLADTEGEHRDDEGRTEEERDDDERGAIGGCG